GNHPIGWGRVVVSEEIYGHRESTPTSAPADIALQPTLHTRWTAPACWFDLAAGIQVSGQLIGWSLATALPLRELCDFTDVLPCYDHEARRLYLVAAQPGGKGLANWTYAHAEELLPLAYDVALSCRNDSLLEPLSRADMDWLLALLGRQPTEPISSERARMPEPARRPELIEGPPNPVYTNASAPARQENAAMPAPAPGQPESTPAATPPRQDR